MKINSNVKDFAKLLTPTEVHDIGVIRPHHDNNNDRKRDPAEKPRAAPETRGPQHHDVTARLTKLCTGASVTGPVNPHH